MGSGRLIFVGSRENLEQLVEWRVIVPLDRRLNHRLDAVVARDEGRIAARIATTRVALALPSRASRFRQWAELGLPDSVVLGGEEAFTPITGWL
jgi:hypothetical protein